jgi:peroxiredoxin (alkyl hydroperoxide reductase subunit C)
VGCSFISAPNGGEAMKYVFSLFYCFIFLTCIGNLSFAKDVTKIDYIYDPGELRPVDSELKVTVGDLAPDFILSSIHGKSIHLKQFRGKKNVVLSFVPAAWTPVCSDQWPGYNIAQNIFENQDAVLLGITVDNIPTLHAWVQQMGPLWFDVLSDFWPHGDVASMYGVLRSDGTADRALIFIDKTGVVREIIVSDINVRPELEDLVVALKKTSIQ